MRRSLIAATALAGIFAALPAAPALAAVDTTLSTSTVKLSPTGAAKLTVTTNFGECVDGAGIEIAHSSGYVNGFNYKEFTALPTGKATATFSLAPDDTPGTWYVSVYAAPCDENADFIEENNTKSFTVKRPTTISSFNAAPEPVAKGKTLTVSGFIKRMDPFGANGPWVGARVSVRIDFRAKGTSAWVSKGTVASASTGKFIKKFTAVKDGDWRAVYAGNSTHTPSTSKADFVDVK